MDCSNGEEAIEILEKTNIDLIFCDLYMPKVDGFGVLKFLRNRTTNHDIPFIVVTGEAGKDDIVKAVNIGAEDYLLKPFQTQELEKKTDTVLRKYFSPNPLLFHIRLSERALLVKDFETAEQEIEKALKINSKSGRANHAKAMISLAKGESAEAIAVLKASIAHNPNFLKNYHTLGDIHLSLKDSHGAIEAMRSELDINPKNVKRQVQLAKLLYKSGDFHGAIEHYRLALLEDSKEKNALFGMGMAHVEVDNLEKAVYYFKRMRRHNPDSSKPLQAIVKYALEAGNPRIAELALRDEKKNFPKRLDTYIILTQLYVAKEMWEEALGVCDEGLVIDNENKNLLNIKGNVEQKLKKYEDAEKTFKKLAKLLPGIQTKVKLAELKVEQGRHGEAVRILQKCLKSPKTRGKILQMIAVIEAKSKQLTKAYYIYLRCQGLGLKDEKTILATNKLKKIIVGKRLKKPNRAS